jgi:hypothetical protein
MPTTDLERFLFIYQVRPQGGASVHQYCIVVALGSSFAAAEAIAINHVHQQDLHIVRADTATPAPWLDADRDRRCLAALARFGVASELLAA